MRQLGREDSITPYWVHAVIVSAKNARPACEVQLCWGGSPLCLRAAVQRWQACKTTAPYLTTAPYFSFRLIQDGMMRATPTSVLNRNVRAAMQQKRLEAKQRKAA